MQDKPTICWLWMVKVELEGTCAQLAIAQVSLTARRRPQFPSVLFVLTTFDPFSYGKHLVVLGLRLLTDCWLLIYVLTRCSVIDLISVLPFW